MIQINHNCEHDTVPQTRVKPFSLSSSKPLPRGGRAICSHHHNQIPNIGHCKKIYNGCKSFDEICCSTGMSFQQLETDLARDKHVIVLLK